MLKIKMDRRLASGMGKDYEMESKYILRCGSIYGHLRTGLEWEEVMRWKVDRSTVKDNI